MTSDDTYIAICYDRKRREWRCRPQQQQGWNAEPDTDPPTGDVFTVPARRVTLAAARARRHVGQYLPVCVAGRRNDGERTWLWYG